MLSHLFFEIILQKWIKRKEGMKDNLFFFFAIMSSWIDNGGPSNYELIYNIVQY